MVDDERQVRNRVALLQEQLLVERLHLRNNGLDAAAAVAIQVLRAGKDLEVVGGADGAGVFVQEARVGLEVNDAAGFEEGAVALQEKRRAEARILAAVLRIGEGQPDLGQNFITVFLTCSFLVIKAPIRIPHSE